MVWTRPSKDDFARWAKVTGDNGWSWNSLLPYMLKVRMAMLPSDDVFVLSCILD
jgi:choline dehydrogenase-like flavoprotein